MRLPRLIPIINAALFLVIAGTEPALAAETRGFLRQIFVMWLPLLLIIGLWLYFIRKMGAGKQAQVIERSIPHMDALEQKLDRIIELLERPRN